MLRERCARLLIRNFALDAHSWHLNDSITHNGDHFAALVRDCDQPGEYAVYCIYTRPTRESAHGTRRSHRHRHFSTSTTAEAATDSEGPPKGKLTALPFRVRRCLSSLILGRCYPACPFILNRANLACTRRRNKRLLRHSRSITARTSS